MTERPIFPAEWNIGSYVPLADTHSSLVWKVERSDYPGEFFVIKRLKPAGMEELRGAHYLDWQDGHGAARLYGLNGTSMLLEYAGSYHLDEHLKRGKDAECLQIFGEVLNALHTPSPAPIPADLQPLDKHFSGLFAVANESSIYADGTAVAKCLLATPHKAIPPLAENFFNIFYNPLDRDDLCLDLERAQRMAEHFAPILKCDPAYVLDYAFAYGCLSAAWHREDGNDADEARELKIASALRHLRQTAYSL